MIITWVSRRDWLKINRVGWWYAGFGCSSHYFYIRLLGLELSSSWMKPNFVKSNTDGKTH